MDQNYGGSLDLSQDLNIEKKIEKKIKEQTTPKDEPIKKPKEKPKNFKFNPIWTLLLFLSILILITIFIRLETAEMPYFDNKALSNVQNYLQQSIMDEILQSKNILPSERESIAKERYDERIKDPETKKLTLDLSEDYKSYYRDNEGINYLYGADPYFYFKQIKEYNEEGIKPKSAFPYVYVWSYKFIKIFNPDTALKGAIFYLPVLFGVLTVILIFFITRKLTNDIGGFIAALFLAINPSFLLNTRAGFIDTNSLNLLLSMAIVYLFLHTIDLKKKSIFTGILMVAVAWFFLKIWSGGFYIVLIIAGYLLALLFIYLLINTFRKKSIVWISSSIVFIATNIAILILFINSKYLIHILSRFKLIQGFFPSGYQMVAELQGYSLEQLSAKVGGYAIVILAVITIVYLIYKVIKEIKDVEDISVKGIIQKFRSDLFIIIYFVSLAFVPFFAKRFTSYFVPAFCIALGAGLYYLMPKIINLMKNLHLNIKKSHLSIAVTIIFSIIIILSVQGELRSNMQTRPYMNDAIYNTALEIRYNSSENAKINLWWDFGYLYEAIADRKVAFHGGSFDSSRLHWISTAFLTGNENLSAGILRMLDCGAENKAHNLLADSVGDIETIDTLHKLLSMSKEDADLYIKDNNFNEKLIKHTHCNPKESFIIAGDELNRKIIVLNYYANFDFKSNIDKLETKDLDYDTAVQYFIDKYNFTKQQAQKYQNELFKYDSTKVPPVSFKSNNEVCKKSDDLLMCGDYLINLSSMDASLRNLEPPAFIFYNGTVLRKDYDNPGIKYTVVVLQNKEDYEMFLVNPEFDKSVLLSLLYFKGANLDHFEFFHEEKKPQEIYSYRIK